MARKKSFHIFKIVVLLFTLVFWNVQGSVWAAHDQGQGKSQHPEQDISVAPEPSGLLLFAVGGMIVAYRCRKRKNYKMVYTRQYLHEPVQGNLRGAKISDRQT